MKEWQQSVIIEHRKKLIENTICNASILASLSAHGCITESDREILIQKGEYYGNIAQSDLLYSILMKKGPECYDVLVACLKEECQSGAASILENRRASMEENAGTSSNNRIWFAVPQLVSYIKGRKDDLSNLHAKIHREYSPAPSPSITSQITIVTGLGGIGKTELCTHYAHQHSGDFDGNVIWINADNEMTTKSSYINFCKEWLSTTAYKDGEEYKELSTIAEEIFRFLSNKKCLLIFDNLDDVQLLYQGLLIPQTFHPGFKFPKMLITSRSQDWGIEMEIYRLKVLAEADAMKLVTKGTCMNNEAGNVVLELVKTLECFPLALQQAIAYIHDQRRNNELYSIKDYLEEYNNAPGTLLQSTKFQGLSNPYRKTILSTIKVAVDSIAKKSEKEGSVEKLAIKILNVISFLAPDNIETKMFLDLADKNQTRLNAAIATLSNYSLLTPSRSESSKEMLLNIHRLVQDVIRLDLEERQDKELVLKDCIKLINELQVKDILRELHHPASIWRYAIQHGKIIADHYFNSTYGRDEKLTPLHLLAREGNAKDVEILLNTVDRTFPNSSRTLEMINTFDKYNRTPFYLACERGYIEVAKLLLSKHAATDTKSCLAQYGKNFYSMLQNFGRTPLHVAAMNGHLNIAKLLVTRNKSLLTAQDNSGRTAAELAAHNGQIEIVEFLKPGSNAYHLSSLMNSPGKENGNLTEIQAFLEAFPPAERKMLISTRVGEWTLLHQAALNNYSTELLQFLLDSGAEVEEDHEGSGENGLLKTCTPLTCAAGKGHLEIVRFFIGKGADPKSANVKGWTALHAVAQNGRLEVAKYLLEELEGSQKIDVNILDLRGDTPLHLACWHGHTDVAKYLLEQGADINKRSVVGVTPILNAGIAYNFDIVKYFLEERSDLLLNSTGDAHLEHETLVGQLGLSLLHIAAAYDHVEMLTFLTDEKGMRLEYGVGETTPLHIAVLYSSPNAIRFLVEEKGCNVDAQMKISRFLAVFKDAIDKESMKVDPARKSLIGWLHYFQGAVDYNIYVTPCTLSWLLGNPDTEYLRGFSKENCNPGFLTRWLFWNEPLRKTILGLRNMFQAAKANVVGEVENKEGRQGSSNDIGDEVASIITSFAYTAPLSITNV